MATTSKVDQKVLESIERISDKTKDNYQSMSGFIDSLCDNIREMIRLGESQLDDINAANESLEKQLKLAFLDKAFDMDKLLSLGKQLREEKKIHDDNYKNIALNVESNKKELSIRERMAQMTSNAITDSKELNAIGGKFVGLMNDLKNPMTAFLAILVSVFDRFIALDSAAEKFRIDTGLLRDQTAGIEFSVRNISRDMQQFGVDIEKATIAATELTKTFGDQYAASKSNVEFVSLMSSNMGVLEEHSAKTLNNFMGIGEMGSESAKSMTGMAIGMSKAAGIPLGRVMKDVAEASGDTIAFLRGSVTQLIKASVESIRLGISLEKIGSAASKLLDFTSSIGDEMEASVLLGKDLNLQYARELAYAGKGNELAQEQSRIIQEVTKGRKLDFYQQKALANSLGLSLDDMVKMQAKQAELNELRKNDSSWARKYEVKLAEMNKIGKESIADSKKRLDLGIRMQQVQSEQNKLANQFKQLWVEISDVLVPITKALFQLANLVVHILRPFGAFINLIGFGVNAMSSLWDKSVDVTQLWIGFKKSVSDSFEDSPWMFVIGIIPSILLVGKSIQWLGSVMFSSLRLGWPSIFTFMGAQIAKLKGLFSAAAAVPATVNPVTSSLSTAVKSINPASLLALSVAMIAFAGAVWILAKSSQEFEKAGLGGFAAMAIAATGLAYLTTVMIGASTAITAAIPVLLPAIGVLLGFAAAVGILSLAAIGFGKAFQMFVEGFNSMNTIQYGTIAAGLYGLSGALIAFGGSLAAGGVLSFLGGGLVFQLMALAAVAPMLSVAASSLNMIGASLASFEDSAAIDGIKAVTAEIKKLNDEINNVNLLKVAALNLMNSPQKSSVESSGNSSKAVVDKLDQLINLMASGGIGVNIDGSRANLLLAKSKKDRGSFGSI